MSHSISYEDAQMNNVDPTKCQTYYFWIKYSHENVIYVADGFVFAEDANMAANMAQADIMEEFDVDFDDLLYTQTLDMVMFEKAKQELMKKALKV